LVCYPAGKGGHYELSAGIEEIEDYAFAGGTLTSVVIGNDVTTIGEYAFSRSSLQTATLESGVTTIGAYAFYGCYSLTSITIPSSVTSIGVSAFQDSNVTIYCYNASTAYQYAQARGIPCRLIGAPTHVVTFDLNGGTVGDESELEIDYDETASLGPLPTPWRTGYSFLGWYTAVTGGTQVSPSTVVMTDVTYWAHWSAISYLVTFKSYDGSTIATRSASYGAAALAPVAPARVGYTFAGWDTGFSYITSNLTVTALYAATSYTVTFKDYDGSTIITRTVAHGSAAEAPPAPVRPGYTFTGWNSGFSHVTGNLTITALYATAVHIVTFRGYDGAPLAVRSVAQGSAAVAPAPPSLPGYTFVGWDRPFSVVTADLTIRALYSAQAYTVRLDANGGSVSPASLTRAFGAAAGSLPTPVRPGHGFLGWFTAKNGGSAVSASTAVATHVTYYAHWEAKPYTVTFKAYNGKTIATRKVVHGFAAAAPTPPARAGYSFTGWDKSFTNVTANLTVTARYAAKSYTVKFNAAGGKVANKASTSVKRNYGTSLGKLATPKRTGYSFLGWYTAKTGGKKVAASTKVTKNVTYYAHWKAATYKVTYNAAGGKVAGKALSSAKKTYKSSLGKLPIPKKAGYKFQGWYTAKSKGVKVSAKTKVTKNLTLYAHWQRVG
jgi:uncharacterized repeat protein (TIGR02543 family)